MKLTRKKAIALCIELWTWCTETGKSKKEWPKWKELIGLAKAATNDYCWFCFYTKNNEGGCEGCPYSQKFGWCLSVGSPYRQWANAKTPRTRKKYAGLFLEQIKSIEQGTNK